MILSSLATFVKTFFFMNVLTKEELGYLALFQSIIIIVGFLQLGTVFGAYRIVSFSINRRKRINDSIVSFLFVLFSVLMIVFILAQFFLKINIIWFIGIIIGVLSLLSVWNSNMHIVMGRTNKLSFITLGSIVISLSLIPFLYSNSFYGAVLIIGTQPFLISVFSYVFNKDFNFKLKFDSNFKMYLFYCIKIGFIPFLTSILHYVNLQTERWIIGLDLGLIQLGNYYLVFVYISFFSVIPGAIGTLNFPKFMKSLSSSNINRKELMKELKFYYLELILFLIVMSVMTFFILPKVIEFLLPEHIVGLRYVYIVFYGLVLFTLIDPISFIINAKLHYKFLIYVYLISVFVSAVCYSFLYFNRIGSLLNYSYVNLIFYSTVSLGYFVYLFTKGWKSLKFIENN